MDATLGVYMGVGDATLTLRKTKHQEMSSVTSIRMGEGASVQLLHMSSKAFFLMCYNENSFWVGISLVIVVVFNLFLYDTLI